MRKILLIEDNVMNSDMLGRHLRRWGFDVQVAADGAEGIFQASKTAPDLILMDLGLPIIDGWSATRRLKADLRTRSIPVIALTAHAVAGDRERALEAGCDEYETKPVALERLRRKIADVLRLRSDASDSDAGLAEPRKDCLLEDKAMRAAVRKLLDVLGKEYFQCGLRQCRRCASTLPKDTVMSIHCELKSIYDSLLLISEQLEKAQAQTGERLPD